MSEIITKERLIKDLLSLGVQKGDLLNVKCSIRSIGKIEGGVRTLIDSLLEAVGENGTIVTDSFISVYSRSVAAKKPLSTGDSPSYAGALANEMLKHPCVFRSRHPVQKFAAIGAMAKELMEGHTENSYAYDVLRIMCERNGKNLKIGSDEKVVGVGTTHVAIGMMGFKQQRPRVGVYYMDEKDGRKFFQIDWASICSSGLIKFIPLYESNGNIISKGKVGDAEAKITSMPGTLRTELDILKRDPSFFMCSDPDCIGCRLTWEFSKSSRAGLFTEYILNGKFRNAYKVLRMCFVRHAVLPHEKSKMPPKEI